MTKHEQRVVRESVSSWNPQGWKNKHLSGSLQVQELSTKGKCRFTFIHLAGTAIYLVIYVFIHLCTQAKAKVKWRNKEKGRALWIIVKSASSAVSWKFCLSENHKWNCFSFAFSLRHYITNYIVSTIWVKRSMTWHDQRHKLNFVT